MNLLRRSYLLVGLLILTFLKEIIFAALVPIWQTPDEQAHFAQVAYFSELGKMPVSGNDLNGEIFESEKLLGTLRNFQGNNKFTFHPDYKIAYSNSQTGFFENYIENLPMSERTKMVKQEAANYPPLYYVFSSQFYKIFYNFGLIERVYAVRFFSIILAVCLVFVSFLIGGEVFPDDGFLRVSLPILVSFQPMVSYIGAGVNSDNLMNLLFSSLIYWSVLIIKKGAKIWLIIASLLNLWLLYLTKPQFIYGIPILILAVIFSFKKKKNILIFLGIFLVIFLGLAVFEKDWSPFLKGVTYLYSFGPGDKAVVVLSPIQYIKNTLYHTYHEVLPWYWGVFDWLGVTLPRGVQRAINLILGSVSVGFLMELWRSFKRKFKGKSDLSIIFMVLSCLIYFAGISYFDFLFTLSHGFSFGIQGRYFFPVIVPSMLVVLIGLRGLVFERFKNLVTGLATVLMVALNLIALGLNVHIYYDTFNLQRFLQEASQYKPGIFKGVFLEFWLVVYLLSLLLFLIFYLRKSFIKEDVKKS